MEPIESDNPFSNNENQFKDNDPYSLQNKHDDFSNNIQIESSENIAPKRPWKKIILIILIMLSLTAGGVFGAMTYLKYEKYAKSIPLFNLLPTDPNLIITINSNPDSEQIKLLEKNLQKFPGYNLLISKINKDNPSESASQIIKEKTKEYNIDFDQEFRSAFGEKVYVVINDLSPLGSEIQKNALVSIKNAINPYNSQQSNDQMIALNDQQESPKVLGLSTDKSKDSEFSIPKLEFIAATEINDITKAKNLLEKIKAKSSSNVTKLSYAGYEYYEINSPESGTIKIYNGVIGKNWLITSNDSDFKAIIDKATSFSSFSKKEKLPSLIENEQFKNVVANLNSKVHNQSLLSFYVKINFEKFLKKDDCKNDESNSCTNITDYVKYPNDIVMGLDLRSNDDGIGIAITSNKQNVGEIKNSNFTTGIAKKFPEQVDGHWADLFFEYTDLNNLYYSFKNNNLTPKGTEEWNKALDTINSMTGFNFETDIIDQINGDSGLVLFSKKGTEPEGVLMVAVKDEKKSYADIEKFTELIKSVMLKQLSSMSSIYENPSYSKNLSPEIVKQKNLIQEQVKSLNSASIKTTQTPDGEIYSFKIPGNEFISFDFSIKNNMLIIGSHYAAVNEVLIAQTNNLKPLNENALYKKAQITNFESGYSQSLIVTQGAVNIAEYVMKNIMNMFASISGMENPKANNETDAKMAPREDDTFFGISSILRTIKFIHSAQTTDGAFTKSNLFLNIESLPVEEKERAQKVIEKMIAEEK
jgi:hypothetical protein